MFAANLTTFFTAPNFVLSGPTTNSDLGASITACVPHAREAAVVAAFVGSVIYAGNDRPLEQRYEWCENQVRTGKAHLILGRRSGLFQYLLSGLGGRKCARLASTSVRIAPFSWSFALRVEEVELASNISSLLERVLSSASYQTPIEKDAFGGQACPPSSVDDTTAVDVPALSGLFVIVGWFGVVSVAVATYSRFRGRATGCHARSGEEAPSLLPLTCHDSPEGGVERGTNVQDTSGGQEG